MNSANKSRNEFLDPPSGERVLRTSFWALWGITVGSIAYALAAEFLGCSIFYPHFPYKYHVFTIEYPVLGAITSSATFMLAVTTVCVWRSAPPLRKFGIAACLLELVYVFIARY